MIKKCIFFLSIMAIFCVICCCGGKNTVDESAFGEDLVEEHVSEWQDVRSPLEERFTNVTVTENMIYGIFTNDFGINLAYVDKAQNNVSKEIPLEMFSYVESVSASPDGNVYILGNRYDSEELSLAKIDSTENVEFLENFALEDLEKATFFNIKKIQFDNKGRIYLWCNFFLPKVDVYDNVPEADVIQNVYTEVNRIYIKNSAWETIYYEQIPKEEGTKFVAFELDSDNKPVLLINSQTEGLYYQSFDVDSAKLTDAVYLKNSDVTYSELTGELVFTEDGFVFERGGYLYSYNKDTNKSTELIHLISYGILPKKILYLGIKDGYIEIIEDNDLNKVSEYTILSEGESIKNVLTLGTIGKADYLEDSIVRFNRYHSDVRVQIIDYKTAGKSYDEGLQELKLDIISGKAPDLIDVSNIEYKVLASRGVFANLTELMDEELSLDMLVDSVVRVNQIDGKIYALSPSFQVYSIWGRKDLLGNRTGISLAELRTLLQAEQKDLSAVFGFSADEPVLTTLCTFGMNEFINWTKGTCNFDSVYFEEILKFAKEYKGIGYESLYETIQNEEIIMSLGTINEVSDYLLQREMYGGELTFIGYPTSSGSGTALSLQGGRIAINANSENKECAWKFIKDYIYNGYSGVFFPVLKERYESVLGEALVSEIVEENGNRCKVPSNSYYDDKHRIQVYEATESDVTIVRELVDSATNCFEYNTEIMNIINEEASYYFAGSKSTKEVAEVIQNRVSIYLKEQVE